ncbi:hypothetical protein LG314_07615 [Agrococcus terreus]|uniref:hypothetical protein n=1 Tax=Agrococcus terreus TaxID=574649 RepID=UPI00384A4BB2
MVVRLPSKYGKDVWAFRNLVPRSIAREVRIESDDDLTITDAGHWSELSPSGTSPAEGTFTGRLTEQGRHEGVNFTITWFDEVGNRREAATWVEGSSSADAWG